MVNVWGPHPLFRASFIYSWWFGTPATPLKKMRVCQIGEAGTPRIGVKITDILKPPPSYCPSQYPNKTPTVSTVDQHFDRHSRWHQGRSAHATDAETIDAQDLGEFFRRKALTKWAKKNHLPHRIHVIMVYLTLI